MTGDNSSLQKSRKRILVVDDHAMVRYGISRLVEGESDLEVCGEAETAAEAIRLAQSEKPDLALIDIMLKKGNGVDLIQQLRFMNNELKILVLSMFEESLYAERVLRIGAMGYLNKEEAPKILIFAIRQVLEGKIYVSEPMSDQLLLNFQKAHPQLNGNAIGKLTNRELEVFQLIGQGLSTKEIAERLYLSAKTVETHYERIKLKLHIEGLNKLIIRAAQWVMEGAKEP